MKPTNPVYFTRTAAGVRVIAYQALHGITHQKLKWHACVPGVMSPGVSLADAISNVAGSWLGKDMDGIWQGEELIHELSNEDFAALDPFSTEGTLLWLSRI